MGYTGTETQALTVLATCGEDAVYGKLESVDIHCGSDGVMEGTVTVTTDATPSVDQLGADWMLSIGDHGAVRARLLASDLFAAWVGRQHRMEFLLGEMWPPHP